LDSALPKIAEETYSPVANKSVSGTRKGLVQVGSRCDFIQHCKANAA